MKIIRRKIKEMFKPTEQTKKVNKITNTTLVLKGNLESSRKIKNKYL